MLDPKLAELCTNRFSLKQGSGSFLCMAKLPFRYAATGVLGDDTERTVLKLQDPNSCPQLCGTSLGNYSVSMIVVTQNVWHGLSWMSQNKPQTCFSQPLQQLLTCSPCVAIVTCMQISFMSLILIQTSPPGHQTRGTQTTAPDCVTSQTHWRSHLGPQVLSSSPGHSVANTPVHPDIRYLKCLHGSVTSGNVDLESSGSVVECQTGYPQSFKKWGYTPSHQTRPWARINQIKCTWYWRIRSSSEDGTTTNKLSVGLVMSHNLIHLTSRN